MYMCVCVCVFVRACVFASACAVVFIMIVWFGCAYDCCLCSGVCRGVVVLTCQRLTDRFFFRNISCICYCISPFFFRIVSCEEFDNALSTCRIVLGTASCTCGIYGPVNANRRSTTTPVVLQRETQSSETVQLSSVFHVWER